MAKKSTPRHELIQGDERVIAKTNHRIDLDSITCHDTCAIILEILKRHFIYNLLTITTEVPEVYLTQFWETIEISKDEKSLGVHLDHKLVVFDVQTLRTVLGLPNVKKFSPLPSLSDVIRLLRELQYDESVIQLRNISHVDRKYIPQPWLTLYSILSNSLTGKETGHEHPSLELMQIFWGVVKQAKIDYGQLIWMDMVNHARQFHKSSTSKIPFYRFTKCLIAHFMEKYPDIDRRSEDKKHPPPLCGLYIF